MEQPNWETLVWFFKKSEIEFLYEPATLLLGVYTEDLKAGVQTHVCTSLFTVVVFT